MQVHGYEVTLVAVTTDDKDPQVSINLGDEVVILSKKAADRLATESQNGNEFRDGVLEAKSLTAAEWQAKRDQRNARTVAEEEARETAQNASSGEAHEK